MRVNLRVLLPVLGLAIFGVGFAIVRHPTPPAPPPAALVGPTEEARLQELMKNGLDALYTARDPDLAVTRFREILATMPSHYGAKYQLAAALTAAARFEEARPVWEQVLQDAGGYGEQPVIDEASRQLQSPGPAFVEGLMARGLEALYQQKLPAKAIPYFEAILAQMPTHYGASYQLAVALESANRRPEAKARWSRVLTAAVESKDDATIASARTSLARLK